MSLLSYYLEYGRHLARHRRGRHHEYVPTNNNASHNNQEKTNSWVCFLIWVWGSPWRLFVPLELRSNTKPFLFRILLVTL